MEEKTMEVTKLKIEQNIQNHQRETRQIYEPNKTMMIQQNNLKNEKYIKYQIDQKAEEQEYYSQVYEKSMLANLDNINFEMPSFLEEELIQ
ncbi:unnamed protein product [Paramecium pentaurelia]|uniref:Uncharacterized protein n=1 Tax=Paramecium pentaurelia TaxID=43138 RepID=A0A8S1TJ82_9CILI|nr:unnamed protein product [Paramecium pentaurelia]